MEPAPQSTPFAQCDTYMLYIKLMKNSIQDSYDLPTYFFSPSDKR
jgi:hypothetical protein